MVVFSFYRETRLLAKLLVVISRTKTKNCYYSSILFLNLTSTAATLAREGVGSGKSLVRMGSGPSSPRGEVLTDSFDFVKVPPRKSLAAYRP